MAVKSEFRKAFGNIFKDGIDNYTFRPAYFSLGIYVMAIDNVAMITNLSKRN